MPLPVVRPSIVSTAGSAARAATTQHNDGRHVRRERNRAAVVEALLSLYAAGNLDPSADEIAERSGLSARSLFRYFDDLEDLCRAAIGHQRLAVQEHISPRVDATAPLQQRLAQVVAHRVALFEAMGTVGLVWRLRAPFQPLLAEELTHWRYVLRSLLYNALLPSGVSTDSWAVQAADALLSFEAYQLLRHDQGLSREAATATLVAALTSLLAPRP